MTYNNSTKKILVIGHADGFGGAQTAFRRLVEFLSQEQYNVRIIAISDINDGWMQEKKVLILQKLPYKTVSYLSKYKKFFSLLIAGINTRRFAPYILITVGLNNTSVLLAKATNSSCFKTGLDFIADRQFTDPLWQKSKMALNGIAFQSPSMLERWKQNRPDDAELSWLPCFPNPPFANITANKNGNFSDIKICYFGRLAANKGLDLLMKAMTDNRIPQNLVLDIWGGGEEEARLKELHASLRLGTRVNLMGKYPKGREGAQLLASYHLLVLCSTDTEGLPLTLLEAMAYGMPLLVTDVGAIKDCSINNPDVILIKPNLNEIAKGLLAACEKIINHAFDPERQKLYYETHFSFSVMAERWNRFLQKPDVFFEKIR